MLLFTHAHSCACILVHAFLYILYVNYRLITGCAPRSFAQYVLVRAESDWHCDKQSMKWRLGGKSNWYYHKLRPQSIRPQSFLNRISSLHSLLISSHFVRELSYQYLKIATRNTISRTSDITHDHL